MINLNRAFEDFTKKKNIEIGDFWKYFDTGVSAFDAEIQLLLQPAAVAEEEVVGSAH